MRHLLTAILIAALVPLAACAPPESGSTSTPPPHVVAGIDSDSLGEGERLYLDDVLEKAPGTKSGVEWRANVISAEKADLDMLFDGERIDFCKGAPRRDRDSFTAQMGRDKGDFTFLRQEAARAHLY
ncbi:hypothetical protein ACFVU4_21260 [Streptomyces sp. NPDC058107]|uniref:hypothetical protein n=1 Tax=Streptomyces sp. NPDC058107 TaxID=3346343 RepID=UPI0036E00499